jgi:hypothetical protein
MDEFQIYQARQKRGFWKLSRRARDDREETGARRLHASRRRLAKRASKVKSRNRNQTGAGVLRARLEARLFPEGDELIGRKAAAAALLGEESEQSIARKRDTVRRNGPLQCPRHASKPGKKGSDAPRFGSTPTVVDEGVSAWGDRSSLEGRYLGALRIRQ